MNRIKINIEIEGEALSPELFVDGEPLRNGYDLAYDLRALVLSAHEDGEFFILTCTCGIHDCAGIYQGIAIAREGSQVSWHIPRPFDACCAFDSTEYKKAIRNAIVEGKIVTAQQKYVNNVTLYTTAPKLFEIDAPWLAGYITKNGLDSEAIRGLLEPILYSDDAAEDKRQYSAAKSVLSRVTLFKRQ